MGFGRSLAHALGDDGLPPSAPRTSGNAALEITLKKDSVNMLTISRQAFIL